ncbi:helix-turn-helix domain-containing protein [Sphingopyxis sp.]|jgi:transcriptional regulator with XRE-family HTH domain|uniref:helix-turn-helix domain-containing protein n=1 Tax=Sphingopyxis sp. TaxID=1908224 RepID=UPI003F71936E
MLIADRLKARMEACELSQAALAREVGVSQQSIGRLVSGEAIGSRYLHKIAAALRTTPSYLTGETDDPESDTPDEALTADEREVLEYFRRLTSKDQAAARQIIRSLAAREPTVSATVHAPSRTFSTPNQAKGRAA